MTQFIKDCVFQRMFVEQIDDDGIELWAVKYLAPSGNTKILSTLDTEKEALYELQHLIDERK